MPALQTTIKLDGSDTVELDFKCLHPSMLYSLEGIQLSPKEDCYDVGLPKRFRDLVKVTFNCILDCSSRGVTAAVENAIDKAEAEKNPYPKIKSVKRLIEKTIARNIALKRFFGSGCSLGLQYVDSMIAEDILRVFVEANKPILCVHDSFIVKTEDKDLLKRTMKKAYKERTDGFTIKIKVKRDKR